MKYFRFFPKLNYDLDGDGNTREIVDSFRFAKIMGNIKDDITYYRYYDIPEGERPDHTSYKLYGTPDYYWTFFVANPELKNIYADWPLQSSDLKDSVSHKYEGKVLTVNTNDFFDKFTMGETLRGLVSGATAKYKYKSSDKGWIQIENLVGNFSANEIVRGDSSQDFVTIGSQIDYLDAAHHFEKDDIPVTRLTTGAVKVTNLQYEEGLNEARKKIRIIRPEFINDVVNQFRAAIND